MRILLLTISNQVIFCIAQRYQHIVDIDDLLLDISFVVFTCVENMIMQSLIMLDLFL